MWTLWHCPAPASLSDTASWDQAWDTWPLSSGNQWTSSSWTMRSWWMWTITVPDGYIAVSHTSHHLCSSVLSISLILAVWYFIQFWDGTSGRVWLYDNFIVMRLMLWDYQKYNLCVIYVDNTVACPKSPAGSIIRYRVLARAAGRSIGHALLAVSSSLLASDFPHSSPWQPGDTGHTHHHRGDISQYPTWWGT